MVDEARVLRQRCLGRPLSYDAYFREMGSGGGEGAGAATVSAPVP